MRRRAFTMIELLICLGIATILLVPVGSLGVDAYRSFTAVSMQSVLKSDCLHAAERIFRKAARTGGYRVDGDNHGLTFQDGTTVRWQGERLEMTGGLSLLTYPVRDFTAVRRNGILTLNLQVEARMHSHGKVIRLHEMYEYPRVGWP